jgi:menaquinol-cytochrome c reductase iron-sulfur subunit
LQWPGLPAAPATPPSLSMAAHETTPRRTKRKITTVDRGLPGAFEGETVTRRRFMEGGALAAGGIASVAFGLPALGFALGPVFKDTARDNFQDVGPESDFSETAYVPKVISLVPEVGETGKTTVYIRKVGPGDVSVKKDGRRLALPYVAISTRCTHLGCPVRFVNASQRFICPCHGGVYGADGEVVGGPPVRPLDRFVTKVQNGRVLVGPRFSVNRKLEWFPPRDPSNHLDDFWKYLYPPRPTV